MKIPNFSKYRDGSSWCGQPGNHLLSPSYASISDHGEILICIDQFPEKVLICHHLKSRLSSRILDSFTLSSKTYDSSTRQKRCQNRGNRARTKLIPLLREFFLSERQPMRKENSRRAAITNIKVVIWGWILVSNRKILNSGIRIREEIFDEKIEIFTF